MTNLIIRRIPNLILPITEDNEGVGGQKKNTGAENGGRLFSAPVA
jgi:hypothetical protein